MDKSTNKAIIYIFMICTLAFTCFAFSCTTAIHDDRIDPDPEQEKILSELIQQRKNFMFKRGVADCVDTTVFFATFSFVAARDSLWLYLDGDFMSPCILHDSINGKEWFFKGYFLRDSVYCFFYCFSASDTLPLAMQKLMKGWRLRDPSENPDFFQLMPDAWDPCYTRYYVDSDGKYHFLNYVH